MQALNDSQLVNVNRIDFLLDQIKFGLIGIVTIAGLLALFFYHPFKSYRFIGFTFLAVILLYTIMRAKSYYSIGLYPVLFAFGSVYLEAILKKRKAIIIPILASIRVIVFILIAKFLMPVQSPSEIIANHDSYEKIGLLRWEDGKNHLLPQDFADMVGWKEMAEKTLLAYELIPPAERENTLILCDNYGETGAVNYFNRGKMPQAYSFNTDYIFWMPKKKNIRNVVLVGDIPDQDVIDLFTSVKLIGKVENEYAREKGATIYLLSGAFNDVSLRINKEATERIQKFDIF
jgi:hypothetical protein